MVAEEHDWPDGLMFWPPLQIGWQSTFIARMFLMRTAMLAADLGTGKSVMALGVAGLAFEQDEIDHVLVVCKPNKLAASEWPTDFRRFTRIQAAVYHGPRRKRILEGPLPQAIITTYETARDDLAVFPPKKSRSRTLAPGPLMTALRGKRVLVVYDEITKLGRRTSNLYKAHHWALQQLRKHAPTMAIGLSATPMDTELENIYNEMRVIIPSMPLVKDFEENVVAGRDDYGRPYYRKDGKEWLRAVVEPWILRKRKSDPDVRGSFPPLIEEFRRLRMHPDQSRLYEDLEDLAWDPVTRERIDVPGLDVLLKQLAGDPWAVLEAGRTGSSPLARMVAAELAGELEKCSSAKADELIDIADLVMAGGGKILVFTFFGGTVIPALRRRLGDRPVYEYHGGLTQAERERQKTLFRDHNGGAILLASDAGADGMNLPWITYTIEYEAARTHALRLQRSGRGHRLGKEDPLTFITLVLEGTIEAANSVPSLMARNADQDLILGDEGADGYVTAGDRRELYAQARPRRAG